MKIQKSEGYFESVFALVLQYTLSTYLHEWGYFYNALIIYFGMMMLNRKIAKLWLIGTVFTAYFVLVCQTRVEFVLNLACCW